MRAGPIAGVALAMAHHERAAWVAWAKGRGAVRLEDGRVGYLMHFSLRGGAHKVWVSSRHERVANDGIEEALNAEAPALADATIAGGAPGAESGAAPGARGLS